MCACSSQSLNWICTRFECVKLGGVKPRQITSNSPKFSPSTVLHTAVTTRMKSVKSQFGNPNVLICGTLITNCEPSAVLVGCQQGLLVNFLMMTGPLQCQRDVPLHQYGKMGQLVHIRWSHSTLGQRFGTVQALFRS